MPDWLGSDRKTARQPLGSREPVVVDFPDLATIDLLSIGLTDRTLTA